MKRIERLNPKDAHYTVRPRKANYKELFKILNQTSKDTVEFHLNKEGRIYSQRRRIFSVTSLDANRMQGRRKESIFMATTPYKDNGFYLPWDPDMHQNCSEVLQIVHIGKLIFENEILIKKLGLENLKCP